MTISRIAFLCALVAIFSLAALRLDAQLTGRVYLTAPLSMSWDEANGTDAGNCTSAPCQTPQYVWSVLQNQYDLAGQNVHVSGVCKGNGNVSFTHGLTAYGVLMGQYTPNQVEFEGDVTNPRNCLMKLTSGNCLAMSYGSMMAWTGFKCDTFQTYTTNVADEITVGDNSLLILGRPFQNDNYSVVWGDSINPANHMSIANGRVYVAAPDPIEVSPSFNKSISQTTPTNSNYIHVSDCSGIQKDLGVWGPATTHALPSRATVVGCNNGLLQIGNFTTRQLNVGELIYFSRGGNAHASISQGGKLAYYNNCGQPPYSASITGDPYFFQGFWAVFNIAEGDLGQNWSGASHGPQYDVEYNGVLNTCGQLTQPGDGSPIVQNGGQVH